MKKHLAFLLFLITPFSFAQERFSIALLTDAGLALRGDHHGHPAGTFDLLGEFTYHHTQQKYGRWIYYVEFEHAPLKGGFKRYSGNIGYSFNKIVIPSFWFVPRMDLKNLSFTTSLGYGAISRYDFVVGSFGYDAEFSYRINKTFKLNLLAQASERSDMIKLYGKSDSILGPFNTRESLFIGVEVSFY
ncbi:hypothetical protein AXE80_09235 [Wenyingzhuangia fucanilytica]|uniref:Outer membrane protein beta-barrel domain-containing protein n=1 Tax=Wenyingzhuangia fucanilytica TaxID=1790137 RepID=A0A1B1Y6N6_9FLAO|nr:hypothetical protein [Wenyingzhuangia fucanilytica]ANW96451.1 hypothetical protein AXE80_09235 [Wenyingzhuangia fucanilytica]